MWPTIESRLTPLRTRDPHNTLRESQQIPSTNRISSFFRWLFICGARSRNVPEETSTRFSPEVCKEMVRKEMEELQQDLEAHVEDLSKKRMSLYDTDTTSFSPDIFSEIIDLISNKPTTRDELTQWYTKIERQIGHVEFEILKLTLQKQDLEYAKFTGISRKQEASSQEVNENELLASYKQKRNIYHTLKMILFLDKRLQLLLQHPHQCDIRRTSNLRELIKLNRSLLQELITKPPALTKITQIQEEVSEIQNKNFSGHWMGEGPFSDILDKKGISKWHYDPKSRYQSYLDNPFLAMASKRLSQRS